MLRMLRFKILGNRKGQGIVEYILIVVLLAMIAFAVVRTLGVNVKDLFNRAGTKVQDAGQGW